MTTASRAGARAAALVLAAVLLALTAAWATPAPAYACSCAESSDAELTARADVIFTATVAGERVDEGAQTRTLTFTVNRVYKGEASSTEVVTTASSGASCGLELSGPGPFLVFADEEPSGLTANLCGGTRVGQVPAGLGAGRAPQPDPASPSAVPPGEEDPQSGRWLPVVGMILAAAAAAVVGIALVRQRPR